MICEIKAYLPSQDGYVQ